MIAWWVLIPLLLFFDPDLPRRLGVAGGSWDVISFTVWYNIVRPIAVGTMLVGACHTLFSMRSSIVQSLKGAFAASAEAAHEGAAIERTEKDIPHAGCSSASLVLLVPIVGIYYYFTHGLCLRDHCGAGDDAHRASCFRRWAATWWDWWAARTSRSPG